jgi:alpha-amylase
MYRGILRPLIWALIFGSTGLSLKGQDTKKVYLQGFWWDFKNNNYPQGWANYLADLSPRLRKLGLEGIWVPVNQKNANPNSVGYSPFDHYDLGDKYQKLNLKTPFGDKDEFLRMVGILHQNGLDVVQDIVLNHLDGAGSATSQGGVDSAGLAFYATNRPLSNYNDIPTDPTSGFKNFRYVSFLTPASTETRANYLARAGRWPKNWQNFNPGPGDNRYTGDDLTRITFGPDVAYYQNSKGLSSISTFNPVQGDFYMRNQSREWLIWFKKQTGVDGFRLDAIKHFPNAVSEDMIWNLQNNAGFASGTDQMFTVGEWVGGKSELDAWVDAVQGRAGTFDFGLRGFSGTPGLYGMVYGLGNYDLSNLPGQQQDRRSRTVPFINNHDTFRPTQPATGSPGLQANGNYPVDANGNPRRWNSNSELSPNIDPREPRLTAAYAIMMSMDGHPTIFFEDLFDVGTTGKRFTHLPTNETDLPIRQSIANLIRCHKKFDFKSGGYRVRSSEPTVFFDGSNAQDLIVFERSAKAIIAVTDNFTTAQAAWIDCDFQVGTVLKDYTGNFPNVTVVTRPNGVPGGRVRVQAPPCNGTVNNTIAKGVAIYAPANQEAFFNQPFPLANRQTTHEWEMADDLGDSNPRSLRQGGALPANSKEIRRAGKIYAEGGKTIIYRLFPSFNRDLTLLLTDGCGQVLDSVRGSGNLVKTFTPALSGWYHLAARNSLDTNSSQRVWIRVNYTAPDSVDALATRSRLLPYVDLGPNRYGCTGSSISLNANFDAGLSYVWKDGIGNQIGTNPTLSVNQAGTYSVELTNPQTGCKARDTITIFSFENPPPAAVVIRVGDTLKLTNITPGAHYQWRINGALSVNDTLTYLVIPSNALSINLITRNDFGCQTVTPNLISSVDALTDGSPEVMLFPNPASAHLGYRFEEPVREILIFDIQGRKVLSVEGARISGEEGVLDIHSLKNGLHLVRIIGLNGLTWSRKILVQK